MNTARPPIPALLFIATCFDAVIWAGAHIASLIRYGRGFPAPTNGVLHALATLPKTMSKPGQAWPPTAAATLPGLGGPGRSRRARRRASPNRPTDARDSRPTRTTRREDQRPLRRRARPPTAAVEDRSNMRLDDLPIWAFTLAGMGVHLELIWQSIAQIKAAYGARSEVLLTNFLTKIWFPGMSDLEGLSYVERL